MAECCGIKGSGGAGDSGDVGDAGVMDKMKELISKAMEDGELSQQEIEGIMKAAKGSGDQQQGGCCGGGCDPGLQQDAMQQLMAA
jgi:hypothetical protein